MNKIWSLYTVIAISVFLILGSFPAAAADSSPDQSADWAVSREDRLAQTSQTAEELRKAAEAATKAKEEPAQKIPPPRQVRPVPKASSQK